MNLLLKELEKSQKYSDFLEQIKNKKSPVEISGLTDVLSGEILVDRKVKKTYFYCNI